MIEFSYINVYIGFYWRKLCVALNIPQALKAKLKITQLEKVHFIKVNELKLIEVELF